LTRRVRTPTAATLSSAPASQELARQGNGRSHPAAQLAGTKIIEVADKLRWTEIAIRATVCVERTKASSADKMRLSITA